MLAALNLKTLRTVPRIGYYFRYDLHSNDFHELIYKDRLYGHYTAKPLYGSLTATGHVDKSAGFNGAIATLYIPLAATAARDAQLFITHTDPGKLLLADGRKNWKTINETAARHLKRKLTKTGKI